MGVASCRWVRPDLMTSSNSVPLARNDAGQHVERGEGRGQRGQHRQAHRRRDDVVGALGHVDVIVRVHRGVDAARRAEDLVGPVGEHLVNVHVVAGARAGLIHVHDELIAMLPAENLVGRLDDGVGQARLQPAGLLVRERGRALDPDHRVHEGRQRTEPGDRKILGRAQRLDAVQRVGRDGLFAQGIAFEAGGGHGLRRSSLGAAE